VLELGPAEQNQALCSNKFDAIIFGRGASHGLTPEATMRCRQGWCGSPARQSNGSNAAGALGGYHKLSGSERGQWETATGPATVLAVIAAVRHSGRLNGMAESTLPAG
jgi:hypothetical protein